MVSANIEECSILIGFAPMKGDSLSSFQSSSAGLQVMWRDIMRSPARRSAASSGIKSKGEETKRLHKLRRARPKAPRRRAALPPFTDRGCANRYLFGVGGIDSAHDPAAGAHGWVFCVRGPVSR